MLLCCGDADGGSSARPSRRSENRFLWVAREKITLAVHAPWLCIRAYWYCRAPYGTSSKLGMVDEDTRYPVCIGEGSFTLAFGCTAELRAAVLVQSVLGVIVGSVCC